MDECFLVCVLVCGWVCLGGVRARGSCVSSFVHVSACNVCVCVRVSVCAVRACVCACVHSGMFACGFAISRCA